VIFVGSISEITYAQPMAKPRQGSPAAAVIGFLGNEAVAATGKFARGAELAPPRSSRMGYMRCVDGLTSLASLVRCSSAPVLRFFPFVDPLIGFLIGIAILFINAMPPSRFWVPV